MQNIGNGTIPHVQESQPQGPVDLAALANALVTLQTKVATLETRSSQMDELLAKLDTLSKENEAQRKYIAELEARLSASADFLSGPDTLRETAAPHRAHTDHRTVLNHEKHEKVRISTHSFLFYEKSE
jgi:hypothetical protein